MAQPREAFVLKRGAVRPAGREGHAPACRPCCRRCPKDAPLNRLGLAQWLVDPSHPLTARVTVNRFWQQYFGTGIVKTAEDFGAQGELPSHPELLDWLAAEFIASGWDVKHMQRLIVMSARLPAVVARHAASCSHATRRTGCWPGGRGSAWTPR